MNKLEIWRKLNLDCGHSRPSRSQYDFEDENRDKETLWLGATVYCDTCRDFSIVVSIGTMDKQNG